MRKFNLFTILSLALLFILTSPELGVVINELPYRH